jgi:hypothetical protein
MSTNPQRSRATAFGLTTEREQSGSFPIERVDDSQQLESQLVIAELAPDLVSMIPDPPLEARRSFAPPPRPATPSERAELVIEDLSLQLDNPYLASSLVPPPKQPLPMRRIVAIGAGMLAAAAIGAVVQLSVLRSAPPTDVNAGAAGIAPPVAAAGAIASTKSKQSEPSEAVIAPAPAPVVAPVAVEAAPPAAPVLAAAQAPKVDEPRAEQAAAATAVVPAAPVRIARVTPPVPPEPTAPVAEAAMPAEPVVPAVDLPQYPTREQVTAGFESVRAALAQCAAGRAGTADIKASIASNGRIVHALIGGDFSGSVEGSCMARAVREAQFPAFSEPRLKVSYPISL